MEEKKKQEIKKKIEKLMMSKWPIDKPKLRKALLNTKWLRRFEPEEITIEVLEELMQKVLTKYPIKMNIMKLSHESYSCCIVNSETNAWVETIHFKYFQEMVYKLILVLYGYCVLEILFMEEVQR